MSDIQFEPGQQVRVNHVAVSIVNGEVTGRVVQPEFIGTIVGYWRNGNYIVREPEHGTTMAYSFMELSHVQLPNGYERYVSACGRTGDKAMDEDTFSTLTEFDSAESAIRQFHPMRRATRLVRTFQFGAVPADPRQGASES